MQIDVPYIGFYVHILRCLSTSHIQNAKLHRPLLSLPIFNLVIPTGRTGCLCLTFYINFDLVYYTIAKTATETIGFRPVCGVFAPGVWPVTYSAVEGT